MISTTIPMIFNVLVFPESVASGEESGFSVLELAEVVVSDATSAAVTRGDWLTQVPS